MNWLAPEIEVTIGEHTRLASVHRLEVAAARGQPVATAFLELSNVRFEWGDLVADGDPLVLRWGYRGHDLEPLFDGTVHRAHAREYLKVWGQCRARALMDTRITRTYQDETADAVVGHVVGSLGFSSLDIAPCEQVIDKLPLRNSTVVQALEYLDRRLELDRAFFADPEGGFHWNDRDTGQDPVFVFTHGENILDLQSLPGHRQLLTVMGAPVWHSQVVAVVDAAGNETLHFVEQVRHTSGSKGAGIRTHLFLQEVADA